MVEESEEKKSTQEEEMDISRIWAESYSVLSKMCEDSYLNICKPWIEANEEMFEKSVELSKDAAPEKFKEFYDEYVNKYQNTFGKFFRIPTMKSNRDMLEKLMSCAQESSNFYRSWIDQLEKNSRATQEILKGEPDPEKYKECYNMWMKSYDKMFDEFLELPVLESTREIFENYTGMPDIYLTSYVQMVKLWKNSYVKIYGPWIESTLKLLGKMTEIARGEATPEAYKEFYTAWVDTFRETYGKYILSMQPSKEVIENYMQSTNIYLNMYRSWISALEKMSEKSKELSKQTIDPEAYKEFYNLWTKTYEKAFESFFEDMPTIGPMKDMMAPVKNAAKMYSDTFARMSKVWMRSVPGPTG